MKREIQARFHHGSYREPDRPGFSFTTAPLMRTYLSSDPSDKDRVTTMSMPHVMYYASMSQMRKWEECYARRACLIRLFSSRDPRYIIQRLGDSESAKIVSNEADLVKELCSYRTSLCLSTHDPGQSHSKQHFTTSKYLGLALRPTSLLKIDAP
jgi:hypothetical protein